MILKKDGYYIVNAEFTRIPGDIYKLILYFTKL